MGVKTVNLEGQDWWLKVEKGDTLFAIETAEGYLITPYDPAVEEQLRTGREFIKEYRDTFKALAK